MNAYTVRMQTGPVDFESHEVAATDAAEAWTLATEMYGGVVTAVNESASTYRPADCTLSPADR